MPKLTGLNLVSAAWIPKIPLGLPGINIPWRLGLQHIVDLARIFMRNWLLPMILPRMRNLFLRLPTFANLP
jgi:hypothetical protein